MASLSPSACQVSSASRYRPLGTNKFPEYTLEDPFPTRFNDISVAWDDPVDIGF